MHFFHRLAELERDRAAFATATVVARQSPVSAHLGDRALIYADGRMEGFVGGSHARDIVRREALRTMRTGKPILLQILPKEGSDVGPSPTDAERIRVPMGCESNGAVDVYIEPHLPARLLLIVGYTPIAEALARLGAASREYEVVRAVRDDEGRDIDALPGVRIIDLDSLRAYLQSIAPEDRARLVAIVASQGHYDELALEAVLRVGASFVGLLASRTRGAAVLGALALEGIPTKMLAAIRYPIGADIGARSATDVAVSILAQIIQEAPAPVEPDDRIDTNTESFSTDPVCGMDVTIATAATLAEYNGTTYYFCSPACRSAFVADPHVFLTPAGTF